MQYSSNWVSMRGAEIIDSNPVQAWTFFQALISQLNDDEAYLQGLDKTLTPGQLTPYWPTTDLLLTPLLTPYKINGKIKKAQNYHCDPIQVHQ